MAQLPNDPSTARATRDTALIHRIRGGDTAAMNELVRVYGAALVDAAFFVTHSPDLAQDVAQDVFYWVWDNRAGLQVRGSLLAYLVRAVRNRALNVMRQERALAIRQDVFSMTGSNVDVPPSDAAHFNSEFMEALEAALQQLQPRTREIFLMRVDLGMSSAEVAEALGVGPATVRNQLSIAVKALARQLDRFRDLLTIREGDRPG